MKKYLSLLLVFVMALSALTGCGTTSENTNVEVTPNESVTTPNNTEETLDETVITLSNSEILVNGANVLGQKDGAVYAVNDIIYYEDGKDFTYGAGTEEDASSKELADAHTVVHITQPGRYVLTGELSEGQILVDLGEEAKNNPDAVVTLVLNQVHMTCKVAPAILFKNVYECNTVDASKATKVVDTSKAGANLVISDDTFNIINGSYVSKIYEPDSVTLSADGTKVEESKTLYKYDGAITSKMSMNIDCGDFGSGILVLKAENEGISSDMHLTINGGCLQIESNEDCINASEDNVSVITINGGTISALVHYMEGDGIDSNGWVVINGGSVMAQASSYSMDSGIDADKGIIINDGKVIATGNMFDAVSESAKNYVVFNFTETQKPGFYQFTEKKQAHESTPVDVLSYNITNEFRVLLVSNNLLVEGDYTLWCEDSQFKGAKMDIVDFVPSVEDRPEMPPAPPAPPEGGFEGGNHGGGEGFGKGPEGHIDISNMEMSEIFNITTGANSFIVGSVERTETVDTAEGA